MPDLLVPLDADLPEDAAFMARTELSRLYRLGYQQRSLDTITGHMLGVLGQRPAVRHLSCVTDEILAFLTEAGLQIEEDIHTYLEAGEAERHADELIAAGFRLFAPYPLREGRFAPETQLVADDLWQMLNSKRNLGALVPAEHLAPRQMLSEAERPQLPAGGAYLKFAGLEPTGAGYCVRHCPDAASLEQAMAWFRAEGCADELLLEHAIETETTWCANISVTPQRCRFLGAAQQVLAAPGVQSGSVIDPAAPLPEAGIRLAIRIGEAARARGFVGIAGFDVGLARDGKLIVFDPNFRFNACTSQILLHHAAVQRTGGTMPVSESFNLTSSLPIDQVITRLAGPMRDGWLIPTRLVDGRLLAGEAPPATCTGFVLGASRQATAADLDRLKSALLP